MPSQLRTVIEARRLADRQLHELGLELREARLRAGLSQQAVAAAIGTTRRRIALVETGRLATYALSETAVHAAAVGHRLHVRVFPTGPMLRDAAQVALLGRLRDRLPPTVTVHLEVPQHDDRDRRAWDMVLRGPGWMAGVEAITRLRDAQAQLRAAQVKRRDAGLPRLVLLIARSDTNRAALKALAALLQTDFPIGSRAGLAALAAGRDPGGDAVIVL